MKFPWYIKVSKPYNNKKKKKVHAQIELRKIYIIWLFIKTGFEVLFLGKRDYKR